MIVHSQLKFNLELKNLKFLWYSLGVKSWCFSCDKMDWTYKFCAVMNVVTMCILCFFLDAHSVVSLNEPWFTCYWSKSSDSPNIFVWWILCHFNSGPQPVLERFLRRRIQGVHILIFVASRFWSSGNQFCSGRHFKLESDKPQAITVYLSPCLCSSVQFNWTHFNV